MAINFLCPSSPRIWLSSLRQKTQDVLNFFGVQLYRSETLRADVRVPGKKW